MCTVVGCIGGDVFSVSGCLCCLEMVLLFNFRVFVVGGFCLLFDSFWFFLVVGQLSVLVLCVDE